MIDANNIVVLVYPYPWYNERFRHKDVFLFPLALSDLLHCQMKVLTGWFIVGSEREGQNKKSLLFALMSNVVLLVLRLLAFRLTDWSASPRFVFFHIGWSTALLAFLCHILWGKDSKIIVKSDFNVNNGISKNKRGWLEKAIVGCLNSFTSVIVAETKKSAEALEKIFHGRNTSIVLCRNGLDDRSLPIDFNPARDIDVLVVSRFSVVEKGCNTYALTIPHLVEAGLNVMLVGDSVNNFLLKNGLDKSLHLTSFERLENLEVLRLMKRSKIFLNLSESESYIIALVEACAMGCQVLCTPAGVGPDLAEDVKNVSLISNIPDEIISAVMLHLKKPCTKSSSSGWTWKEVVRNSAISQML